MMSMETRLRACRALTQNNVQCKRSVNCHDHRCYDGSCPRRRPHTAHDIARVASGTGRKWFLSRSQLEARAGLDEVVFTPGLGSGNAFDNEDENERSSSEETSPSHQSIATQNPSVLDGNPLPHAGSHDHENSFGEDNVKLSSKEAERLQSIKDVATQIDSLIDNYTPASTEAGYQEVRPGWAYGMFKGSMEGKQTSMATDTGYAADQQTDIQAMDQENSHVAFPLESRQPTRPHQTQSRRWSSTEEDSAITTRTSAEEDGSSNNQVLADLDTPYTSVGGRGRPDIHSTRIQDPADTVAEANTHHLNPPISSKLPPLSTTGAFDNLKPADHDRYVQCLETAQIMLESSMATTPSDEREELRRDLVDATPLLFYGAVDHCMASLDRAMDRLIMLYQFGKETNGAVSDKVEEARAILRRAGGG